MINPYEAHDEPLADWERELLNATEITRCDLCDDNGMRGMFICDHVDRTEIYKRGMALVRQVLRKEKS